MTPEKLERIFGPRVSAEERSTHRGRYALPAALFVAATILLLVSILVPYWEMTLHAPQYPKGLRVHAYVNRLEGDVQEIDELNHYIGMRKLDEAARMERAIAIQAIGVITGLILGAILIHNRLAALLALPALLFPIGFLVDLQVWLWHFGQHLDPHAALSNSVKAFVPPVLGIGRVGQFHTVSVPGQGLILASIASLLVLVGLWAHRRAYKPLVDQLVEKTARPEMRAKRGVAAAAFVLLTTLAHHHAQALDLQELVDDAVPGSKLTVPAGVYNAPVVLAKPIVLEAMPGAVIQGGGHGDLVRVLAPDVAIMGFVIRGTGSNLDEENAAILVRAARARIEDNILEDDLFGIYLQGAPECIVRGNRIVGKHIDIARRGDAIRLWNAHGCRIENNEVSHTRDVIVWYSDGVQLRGNRISGSRYGLHFMYANSNVVEENTLHGNSVGAFLMYSKNLEFRRNLLLENRGPSGYGLGMKDVDGVVARDNRILANRVGMYLDNSPFSPSMSHDIERNLFAFNDIGIGFQPAVQRNNFRENAFVENLEQVAVIGSGDFHGNEFTMDGRGNYWSDYTGFDLGKDGIGDMAYRSESLFENLVDRDTKLRLFLFSPAQQAIELASRAAPTFKPRPKLTDTAPLMDVPMIAGPPLPRPPVRKLGAFAGFLALGSIAALGASQFRWRVVPSVARAAIVPLDLPAPLLTVNNLRKRFGRFVAVQDLSWEMRRGEAVALWGRNGAGKTTALKCILGLHRCEGRIFIAGNDAVHDGKKARAAIGYVPQELALPADMGTAEALAFYARLKKVSSDRVEEALREVEMLEHAKKKIGELSGGMKQRVALAVALLSDPPLLVLDEMTSNLDAAGRSEFIALLVRQKKLGKTILFTSHRSGEVAALADRVLILEQGRLVKESAPHELVHTLAMEE
ncbi:MAG TPA: nitrous oxide reductase family maturation protein NosD [bacterium]|nr:nitrous oxide reductase family maturation protein NosD [bacterium]